MTDFETLLTIIMTGIFTGLGVTIGTYLANKGFISHLDMLLEKLENKIKEEKE